MDPTSPIEYDDAASDGDSIEEDDQDLKQEHDPSLPSPSTLGGKYAPAVKAPGHHQKRRRVTRACDECRRKKIKCDGKQPCTHCTVYSYGTFDVCQ